MGDLIFNGGKTLKFFFKQTGVDPSGPFQESLASGLAINSSLFAMSPLTMHKRVSLCNGTGVGPSRESTLIIVK